MLLYDWTPAPLRILAESSASRQLIQAWTLVHVGGEAPAGSSPLKPELGQRDPGP